MSGRGSWPIRGLFGAVARGGSYAWTRSWCSNTAASNGSRGSATVSAVALALVSRRAAWSPLSRVHAKDAVPVTIAKKIGESDDDAAETRVGLVVLAVVDSV